MSTRFTVKSRACKFDIVLANRVTVLAGDSGTGKTSLFNCIVSFNRDDKNVEVASEMYIRAVDFIHERIIPIYFEDNEIYIIGSESNFFWNKYLKYLITATEKVNCYFIITTRCCDLVTKLNATVAHLESHKEGDLRVYHLVYD